MKENKKPVVSIVTVVFNDREHIEQTLQSVLGQTYDNIEYIVIDGASNDGTVDVIKRYEPQLSFFLSEKDNGVYYAMNKSIPFIHGEWVLFMNSGDTFDNNQVLERIFERYVDNGEVIICGDTVTVDGTVMKLSKATWEGKQKYMPSHHQSILIRAKRFIEHPYDTRYRIIADYALFYDLMRPMPDKFFYYEGVISRYDVTGLSSRKRLDLNREHAILFARKFDPQFFWQTILYIKRKLFGYRQRPKYLE